MGSDKAQIVAKFVAFSMRLIILAIIKHSDHRERILGHHYFNITTEDFR